MLLLKPRHQATIAAASEQVPQEKRQTFVDRVAGQLRLRQFQSTGSAIGDGDVDDAIAKALRGLIHNSAA